jgi:uncharacterized membrane protein
VFTYSIEIGRAPADVFAYMADLDRQPEWQERVLETRMLTEPPLRVGSRNLQKRKVPGGPREFSSEITAYDPPNGYSFKGLDGPLRPLGTVRIEPLDGGTRSRVTLDFDFEAHGLGKLLKPLATRDARKEIPVAQEKLKERLESGV